MKTNRWFPIAIVISLLAISCTKYPEDAIITTNFKYYTTKDLYKYIPRDSFINLSENSRKKKILEFCKEELFLKDAIDKGYNKQSKIAKKLNDFKKTSLINIYFEKTVLDSFVTEDTLRDLYEKFKKVITLRHILISFRTKMGYSKELAYQEAERIYQELKKGASFERLARKYSCDKKTADKGGLLGNLTWNTMLPAIRETVYSLKPGDISEPVISGMGYHILKVDSVTERELPPFEKYRNFLKDTFVKTNLRKIRKKYREMVNLIKFDYDITPKKFAIARLTDYYGRKVKSLRKEGEKVDGIKILKLFPLNEVLITWKGGKYTKKDLILKYEHSPKRFLSSLFSPLSLTTFLEEDVVNDLIYQKALRMKLDTTKEFSSRYEKFFRTILIKEYRTNEIVNSVSPDDSSLFLFYQKHKDSLYMEPPKAEVRVIIVSSEPLAKEILKKALAGENFEKLAEKYTEIFKSQKGYLGYISDKQYLNLGKIAMQTPPGKVYSKLIPYGKSFAILKVYQKKEASPYPFQEVKSKVKADYLEQTRKKLEENIFNSLSEKFKLKIHWEKLNV